MGELYEALEFMRDTLYSNSLGVTRTRRISTLAKFFMSSNFQDDDPLVEIVEYFPKSTEIEGWVSNNQRKISSLRRENPRDYFTNRYDLEELIDDRFAKSRWIENCQHGSRLLPFNEEVAEATIVVKLLYEQADRERQNNL